MDMLPTNKITNKSSIFCSDIFSRVSAGSVCLCLAPFILALLFLFLPIQYFVIITFVFLMAVLSLSKPETGLYLVVPLVIIFNNMTGFLYHPIMRFRDSDMENSLILPIFSVFLLIEWIILYIYKSANKNLSINLGNPLSFFFIFFTIFNFFGLYWRGNTNSPVVFLILLSNIILFCYTFSLCSLNRSVFDKVINVFIVCGCIVSIVVIYSICVHPDYAFIEKICRRVDFIFMFNPGLSANRGYAFELSNFTARTLNLTMFMIVCRLLTASELKKIYWLLCVLIFVFFAHCMTASKGGVLSLLAASGFILVFNEKLRKNVFRNCVIVYSSIILIFLVSIVFVNLFGVGEAFRQTNIDVSGNSISIATRLGYWAKGFAAIAQQDASVTGLGLGGYERFTHSPIWPHNTYFSFYFDFGVIGILLLLLMFIHITKNVFKLNLLKYQKTYYQQIAFVLVGGFLVIAIHALADFYYNNSINWIFLAVLFASLRYADKERLTAPQPEPVYVS